MAIGQTSLVAKRSLWWGAGALLVAGLVVLAPRSGAAPDRGRGAVVLPREPHTAVFCGGCFWCMEASLEKVAGVAEVISGYSGGRATSASYTAVSAGRTEHCEAVLVRYDPKRTSYQKLVEQFWRNIDPLAADRQFCDRGRQYRAALFYATPAEEATARASLRRVAQRFRGQKIATMLAPRQAFYPAETYHQDFYRKSPQRYDSYRKGCGRDRRLLELWRAPHPAGAAGADAN